MKCPICNKRPRVFPSTQIKGVVKEWCARCEGANHIVAVWSSTREGLDIAWAPHNKSIQGTLESGACPECETWFALGMDCPLCHRGRP